MPLPRAPPSAPPGVPGVAGVARALKIARIGAALPAYRHLPASAKPAFARWLRGAVTDAGTIYVKLAQAAAARKDIVPPDIAEALGALQTDVGPMDPGVARGIVRAEGHDLDISDVPLSSGSIAQVHLATLPDGRLAAVKVQRPDIREDLDRDLGMLRAVLGWAAHEDAMRSLDEIGKAVGREFDFLAEAAHMRRFRRFFGGAVLVPEVYAVTPRVLVMQYLPSRPVAQAADARATASKLLEVFATQILEFGWVHTDLHAGNVGLVDPQDTLVMYDFGSVAACPRDIALCVKYLMVAFPHKLPALMVYYMRELGVFATADMDEGQTRATEAFVGHIIGYAETGDIRAFAAGVEDIARVVDAAPVKFSDEVLMMLRSFALLEGLCKEMDPGFVVADRIAPVAAALLADPSLPRIKLEVDVNATLFFR